MFPLAEPVTFSLMIRGSGTTYGDVNEWAKKNTFWQDLLAKTNVQMEFMYLGDDHLTTLTALYASRTAGDALIPSNALNDAQVCQFGAAGMLAQLEDYVNDPEIMPNFYANALSYSPNMKAIMTTPDGHIYALATLNSFKPNYLESAMLMNTAWLKQAGMEVPTNEEELYNVLCYFRDNDMNGNGLTDDEIPMYFLADSTGYTSIAASMMMWGIAGKASALDSYIQVRDGVCHFIPTTENFHAALKRIGQWYSEGLIWSEAYTATGDTINAPFKSEVATMGLYTYNTLPNMPYADQYEYIIPPSCDGYDPCVYYHPGFMATKNMFFVSSTCENIEILMHWVDLFYDLDTYYACKYNYPGEGQIEIDADGKYSPISLSNEQVTALNEKNPSMYTLTSFALGCANMDDYQNRIALTDNQITHQGVYDRYVDADVLNKEIWPRPYFKEEDSNRLAELRTDIFNIVTIQTGKWGTGKGNIDAEFDAFVEQLYAAGLAEYVQICQNAYDIYQTALVD